MMDGKPDIVSQILQRQQRDSDLLRELLNFDDTIIAFEHLLKNERFFAKEQKWISQGDPFLNKDGVNTIVTIILTHLNNVFIMTNFSEEDVRRMAEELGHGITDMLYLNYMKWDIKMENLSIIGTTVDHFVYAMLRSSFEEGIRKLMGAIEKRETIIRQEPEKKKSWIPFIGGGNE